MIIIKEYKIMHYIKVFISIKWRVVFFIWCTVHQSIYPISTLVLVSYDATTVLHIVTEIFKSTYLRSYLRYIGHFDTLYAPQLVPHTWHTSRFTLYLHWSTSNPTILQLCKLRLIYSNQRVSADI